MSKIEKDLFGNEIIEDTAKFPKSKYGYYKKHYNYRKAESKNRMCKNCDHHMAFEYHNEYYHKCELLGDSHSPATDIRVGYICDNYIEGDKT